MQFTEIDGMILTGSQEAAQTQIDRIKASGKPFVGWQHERWANHVHANMSAPDREHVRQERDIAADFEAALREAYPERSFVITHIPCYAVSFYQAVKGAPTEGVIQLKPREETIHCPQCEAYCAYHLLPVPDPEFPLTEWGACKICGYNTVLGDIEILTLLPAAR